MSQTTLNLPLSAWILEDGNLYFQWVCKQERRAWNLATQGRYNAYSNINDKVSVMTEMTNDNMHINKHQTTFNHCPIFIVMLKDNAIFKCSNLHRGGVTVTKQLLYLRSQHKSGKVMPTLVCELHLHISYIHSKGQEW